MKKNKKLKRKRNKVSGDRITGKTPKFVGNFFN